MSSILKVGDMVLSCADGGGKMSSDRTVHHAFAHSCLGSVGWLVELVDDGPHLLPCVHTHWCLLDSFKPRLVAPCHGLPLPCLHTVHMLAVFYFLAAPCHLC